MIHKPGRTDGQVSDSKYMDLDEFMEKGYLHEVNRQFFHPLGLAMVIRGRGDHAIAIEGIEDFRDDAEGVHYQELNWDKIGMIRDEQERRRPAREEALGYWIQDEG